MGAERERIAGFGRLEDGLLEAGEWYRWGPYVSERQWGTVREDYSADGNAWDYLPHDHARSRAYRWGPRLTAVGVVQEGERTSQAVGKFIRQADASGPRHS